MAHYAAYFHDFFGAPEREAQIDFLRTHLPAHGSVLDVAAGVGALAIPLAQAGHPVHAIQPDGHWRAVLIARASSASGVDQTLTVLPCHVDRLPQALQVDLALAIDLGSQLPGDAAIAQTLAQMRRHLHQEGRLVAGFAIEAAWSAHPPTLIGRRRFGAVDYEHWSERQSLAPNLWQTRFTVKSWVNAQALDEQSVSLRQRTTRMEDALALLEGAGFEVLASFADLAGTPFGPSTDLVVVAKPA